MIRGILLVVVGLALVTVGIAERGLCWLAAWLGIDFLVLGIAHIGGFHRIFGKQSDGSLLLWSWLAFLPLHILTIASWHLLRILNREPAQHIISDNLVIGRRLLPREIEGRFANYLDLTAEFQEPAAIRRMSAYQCFPILDGSAPDPKSLAEAVGRLQRGRTYIHCAQGHGRTGLFTLAVLLKSGKARSIEEGLKSIKSIRPGVVLSRAQLKCIEKLEMPGELNRPF